MIPLYAHQQRAIDFAISNHGRCALFHEPGLGKTRSGLEIFRHYRSLQPELRLLVVCPLSLINAAWGEDIQKFTGFSYVPFKEIKDSDIVIINYESLISKKNLPSIIELIRKHKFMCILDESCRLKGNKSITTKILLALRDNFPYRLVMSGAPMPNSELELWGQIRFVQSELLNKSFYRFRDEYFHLERGGVVRQADFSELRELFRKGWKYTIANRKALMDKIQPYTHWVKKAEALDLPEQVDETREVTLSPAERKAYKEMKTELITEIGGVEVTAQVALTKLMKLRQVTAGFLYSAAGEALKIGNSKLEELEKVLEELGSQPVIIWVQFRYEVEAIQELISDKYGAKEVMTLYSETPDRDESIRKFKNNEVRYLISHPRSGGHGLTFINCSTMIFFSLDYSYEAHFQSRDRIHRIGQDNKCLYIYLIAKDSIDKELLKVLQRKQSIQDAVYRIIAQK